MPSGQILLADDDAAIRTVLNQALSRAGYEVRSSSNAATLWRWVRSGDFPAPVQLGPQTTAWRVADVERWERSRAPSQP